jgi:transaldolase
MATNPLLLLAEHGQSVWLDNLARGMVHDGRLKRLIDEDGVSGITSNPAIFHKAMTTGSDYDAQIRALGAKGLSAVEIYETLAIQDVQDALDLLRPVFDRANGTDGFVSLEVSPHLAADTEGTIAEARRLWSRVARPNLLVKIPGTPEGVPAIRQCLSEGISVNVTLLFSLDAHRAVMHAHLDALDARMDRGEPVATVASVASFFLSRIDTKVDKLLDGMSDPRAKAIRGMAAVASAKLAYALWKETYSGPRWERLRAAGARVQKPLWASTSTKDKAYRDVKYVEPLIGPFTVNTLPDETVDAFRDHGRVADTVELDLDRERRALADLESLGISLKRVTDELVEEGVEKFNQPFDALLAALEAKRKALIV